jgi:hypothetical protein
MLADSKETCGIDSYGDLIPFELYSKRFSEMSNILSIFFLDCSREKLETSINEIQSEEVKEGSKSKEEFKEPKGICIVKYGCDRWKKKNAVEQP